MRCACIDIGSNTTALLVAEVNDDLLTVLGTRREFTMIGAACGRHGIEPEKISEVEAVVETLLDHARQLNTKRIAIVATHVIREAINGLDLARAIEARTGLPVQVLSGSEEALFSFSGATAGVPPGRSACVIDAGGGSTEITWRGDESELTTASFAIGSSSLRERLLTTDPPTSVQVAAAREFANETFSSLSPISCELALAVGGGATTARKIVGGVIDAAGVDRVLQIACAASSSELAVRFELELDRARLLPASLIVLGAMSQRLGTPLTVGRGGLREGVVRKLAAG